VAAELPLDPYAASRWLGYIGLFGIIGAPVFRALIHRVTRDARLDPDTGARLGAACRRAGLASAVILVLANLARLWFQGRSALDPGEAMSLAAIEPWFEGPGSWGLMWTTQLGAAVVALVGQIVARRRLAAGWSLAMLGAAAAALAMPLTGHAVESRLGAPAGVVLQGLHLLAGGVWLGTLFVLLTATFAATRGRPDERERAAAAVVHAYSPLALTGAGIAIALGLVLAWIMLGSLPLLWTTSYGIALLCKLALLSGVAGLGAWNWRRVRPALGSAPGARRLRFSATAELVIGALLLGVTAVLVALPSPRL
jgi:putative copper export protein